MDLPRRTKVTRHDIIITESKDVPPFLARMTWVDFRSGLDNEDAFHYLVCGIRGVAPAAAAVVPYRSMAQRPEGWQGQGLGGAHRGDDGGLKSHHPLGSAHLDLVLARANKGKHRYARRLRHLKERVVVRPTVSVVCPCHPSRANGSVCENFRTADPGQVARTLVDFGHDGRTGSQR